MQQIQILTREDVAAIVEQVVNERLQDFRSEVTSTVRESLTEVVRAELPQALADIMQIELSTLRGEIVRALEQAIRKVIQQPVVPQQEDEEDYTV
jgi:flagellar biosynthesis/type III secretory pathway protein FliH